jgi:hypothetical protein
MSKYILILFCVAVCSTRGYAEAAAAVPQPVPEVKQEVKQEVKPEVKTEEEPLFDAGEPPFLVRAFGLNYPVYKPVASPENYRLYILTGPYSPVNLCSTGTCFNDFFGDSKRFFTNFELEFEVFKYALGVFGIKTGTGLFIAQANGIFVGLNTRSGKDTVTFVVIPAEVLFVMTLSFWEEQVLIPYVEGGIAYFGFFQTKNNSSTLSGGRGNYVVGGGMKFLLDWMDYRSAWKLDSVHGINDTYFVVSYRYVTALDKGRTMDFSGSMLLFGISFNM